MKWSVSSIFFVQDHHCRRSLQAARPAVSVILWGPPGTGKTPLAQAIAHSSGRRFVELSAVTAGVKEVRTIIEQARADRDLYDASTILFLDEIHRFTKAQQDTLLPGVENGWVTLVAATTKNPSFSVVSPLLSRSLLLVLEPLTDDDLRTLLGRAVADSPPRGLNRAVELTDDGLEALGQLAAGDAQRALTALEAAVVLCGGRLASCAEPTHVGQRRPSRGLRRRARPLAAPARKLFRCATKPFAGRTLPQRCSLTEHPPAALILGAWANRCHTIDVASDTLMSAPASKEQSS